MGTYFLRRILLIIPTFLGATILVFVILQLAPGGPLEQTIRQLQSGGAGVGETAGSSGNDIAGGGLITESALEELKRFYGFDKPIPVRYLIWLGLWPREIESHNVILNVNETEATKMIRGVGELIFRKEGNDFAVFELNGERSLEWRTRDLKSTNPDEIKLTVFKKKRSGILTGDLGRSYSYLQPVVDVMKPRFKVSIFFGVIGFILSYSVCIPLGIAKALRHGTPFDFFSSIIVFIGYSIPGWALGAVLLTLFGGGSFWDIFPLGGFRPDNWTSLNLWEKFIGQAHHAVLPVLAYTIGSFASMTILMKNSLLEQLSQDYVRTAFAKGLSEKRVIWMHTLRNSVIPIASYIGHLISIVIAGSYMIEVVFNIDGFGKMGFEAVLARDYPVTMGFLVIAVVLQLLGNVLSDIALALVDPRIRFK